MTKQNDDKWPPNFYLESLGTLGYLSLQSICEFALVNVKLNRIIAYKVHSKDWNI